MVMNSTKNVKVLVFGDQYSLVSDEPVEQVYEAARHVDLLMREVADALSHLENKKIAVLVALQIMSKYLALQSAATHDDQKKKELIDMIDREITHIKSC